MSIRIPDLSYNNFTFLQISTSVLPPQTMTEVQTSPPGMLDPIVFEKLQASIDEDAHTREELRNILQTLERKGSVV